jgi:mannose-1-phosphate guanylyltransferase
MSAAENWAVVLAGGDGERLQAFTRLVAGDNRPKQFCRLLGPQTLLTATLERLALVVKRDHTLCVVTHHHEPYYRDEVRDLDRGRLVEQPCNRGTTVGIGLALARTSRLAPGAILGFFPADHHYSRAGALRSVVAAAYRAARFDTTRIFLVGAAPNRPETEYGWIVPGDRLAVPAAVARHGHRMFAVAGFFEKPSESEAVSLMERRGLWNTFILVGQDCAFRTLLDLTKPGLLETLAGLDAIPDRRAAGAALSTFYASLPSSDFSREVLTSHPGRLAVANLTASGWTDLGQQSRVLEVMATLGWPTPATTTLAAS